MVVKYLVKDGAPNGMRLYIQLHATVTSFSVLFLDFVFIMAHPLPYSRHKVFFTTYILPLASKSQHLSFALQFGRLLSLLAEVHPQSRFIRIFSDDEDEERLLFRRFHS